MSGLMVNVGRGMNRGNRFNTQLSSLKKIEPSTVLDFNFADFRTYNGSGQIITDLINGVTATLGANDTPSTDDPTILYAGTPQGKAVFDGGDLLQFVENPDFIKNCIKTTIDENYWFTFVFRMPDAWTSSRNLFVNTASSLTAGFNLYINGSRNLFMAQSQGGSSANKFITQFANATFYVFTMGWNPSTGEIVFKVNNAALQTTSETFIVGSGNPDEVSKLLLNFIATSELYRFAGGFGGGLMTEQRATAIYNQCLTDHQKPFSFPTADSLVNTNANCVLDLDATLYNSFPDLDSQYWIDTVSGNKFALGDSPPVGAQAPDFIGGIGSPSSYFLGDGNDRFRLQDENIAELRDLHKTTGGVPVTLNFGMYIPTGSGGVSLLDTTASPNDHGVRIDANAGTNQISVQHADGSGSYITTNLSATMPKDEWITISIKLDFSNGAISCSINGSAYVGAVLNTGTTTTDASELARVYYYDTSGVRYRHFSVYDKLLSDAELTAILTKLGERRS